jgi:hypothetical protein
MCVQWRGFSNINVMQTRPGLYPRLHGTQGQGQAGTGHPLHWDQVLGGQRDEALGKGGQQQDPLGGGPDTPSAAQKPGADQPR